jgi:repressor LexA
MQQKVFDFICRFQNQEGFPPTYSDIATHFGFSSDGTVRTYLEHLERKGVLQRLGKARGIKLLKQAPAGIPIIGSISAGKPKLAIEEYDSSISDLNELQAKDGRFALEINGSSMINAGILDGDIAIIQRGEPVKSGQIAAVLVDDEATLKRVIFNDNSIILKAENPDYPELAYEKGSAELKIIGKYIALIRKAQHA